MMRSWVVYTMLGGEVHTAYSRPIFFRTRLNCVLWEGMELTACEEKRTTLSIE